MTKKRQTYFIIAFIVVLLGTYLLYSSFESRFNTVPKEMKLTNFKNTKHFNISVFGEGLTERDISWVMRLCERFYGRVYQWYGDHSGKEWLTIYIAQDFPDYYRPNAEMILIPTDRVKKKDARFIAIKIAHLLTGAYKWPWYKNHIAAEGLAAYLADKYVGRVYRYQRKYEANARLAKLDKINYFVWKRPQDQQVYIYTKAGAFVKYLIGKYGIKKIKELYAHGGGAWQEVYGHSLSDLAKQWIARY